MPVPDLGSRQVLIHDLRLAWLSFRRNPVLTALTIAAIATGIGASLITITLYHARSGHPIWWKEQQLFAITLDIRSADTDLDRGAKHPEYPPPQLAYRDAQALYRSDIPKRSAMMFKARRVVESEREGIQPFRVMARVTTADFFPMFDVPFLYGAGWSRAADESPDSVIVISKRLNDRLFGGINSVGKSIVVSSRQYRIAGVMNTWMPQPKFYDLNNTTFDAPEEVYIPFGWGVALEMPSAGNVGCYSKSAKIGSYSELLTSDCVWLQYWAELSGNEQRARYQQFLDNYVSEQKQYGRFVRPLNNRVASVSTWLEMNDVVGDESRIQVVLALMFLAVCILNTLGLMLAKFMGSASTSGLRRALGATRGDIVRQHLTEVTTIGLLGGVVGLGIAIGGLWLIRTLLYLPMATSPGNPDAVAIAQSLSHLDWKMAVIALLLSLLTGVLAGLYPAWRVGRLAPASFLKTQ